MASPVKTEWTSVAVPGGAFFDAYLATPPAGQGPGLVLFQEIFGVNAHIRSVAEQYALMNVEADRMTNSLNTMREQIEVWRRLGAVGRRR